MRFLKSGSENVKQVQWSIQNKDAYSIASEPFMIKLSLFIIELGNKLKLRPGLYAKNSVTMQITNG